MTFNRDVERLQEMAAMEDPEEAQSLAIAVEIALTLAHTKKAEHRHACVNCAKYRGRGVCQECVPPCPTSADEVDAWELLTTEQRDAELKAAERPTITDDAMSEALARRMTALDTAWRVLVNAADFLRDPSLAAEMYGFEKMPHVRAVLEALATKPVLESIERAIGDEADIEAALSDRWVRVPREVLDASAAGSRCGMCGEATYTMSGATIYADGYKSGKAFEATDPAFVRVPREVLEAHRAEMVFRIKRYRDAGVQFREEVGWRECLDWLLREYGGVK